MRAIDDAVRSVAAELDLPEPMRSRTLLELRGDLEAMVEALESRGVDAAAARRRALDALVPGPEALEALRRVHRPLYQRLVDRFSVAGRHRLERVLLVLLIAVYLAGGLATLGRFELLAWAAPSLWPVLIGAVAIGVLGVAKLFQLWVVGAHRHLRRGLGLLLVLAGATLVAAFAGAVADFYGVADRLAGGAAQLPVLLPWLQREMVLLSTALLAASAAGLFWLVASIRVARIEQTEAAALGLTEPRREG